ncbi:MAG: FAD-dependent oxidoreductase, partial [Actinobacteria bacterium]|nr:FAD-dependent oxidoreductase [Actinomycetota bacterium]
PVVSVHVIYGSRVTDLPFAVVAGSPVRWVIDKSNAAGLDGGQYLAVSLPAADQYVDMPAGRLREIVLPQLKRLFPAADEASVGDVFVTRERRATIQHEPGVLRLRASADAGLPGLAVAGAWTDTGWPDSMEGAVRSGRSAARKLLADLAARPETGSEESSVPAAVAAPSAGVL